MTTMAEALTGKEVAMEMVRSTSPAEAAQDRESVAKNLMLFFAAPWIGLAYIVAFPFIGVAVLVKAVVARPS